MFGLIKTGLLLVTCWGLLLAQPMRVEATEFNDYLRDVDIYRDAYAKYQIKKGDFQAFGTYASEEELVTEAQKMLLARADVWDSYWNMMMVKLYNQPECPVEIKNSWLDKMTDEVTFLKQHKEKIVAAKTRKELLAVAQDLNQKGEAYGAMAFATNAEVAVSAELHITQTLTLFNHALTERVNQQDLGLAPKETKQRGLSVQLQRLQDLANTLLGIRAELAESSGYASKDSFSKISQEVNPLFGIVSQQYQITKELASGVEW